MLKVTIGSRRRGKWSNENSISLDLGPSSKVKIVCSSKYQDQSGSKRMIQTRVFFHDRVKSRKRINTTEALKEWMWFEDPMEVWKRYTLDGGN